MPDNQPATAPQAPGQLSPAPAPPLGQPQLPPSPPAVHEQPHQPTLAATEPARVISVLPEDWRSIHERLASYEAKEAARQEEINRNQRDAAAAEAQKAGMSKQFDELTKAHELRYNELMGKYQAQEREVMAERLNAVLSDALAAVKIVPIPGVDPSVTIGQLRRLLADEIEVTKDAQGKQIVRDKKTMQPAADYLRERLKSPEFAHFIQGTKAPGSGTDGSRPAPSGTTPPGQAQPGSLESIVADWKDRQGKYGTMGLHPIATTPGNNAK